MLERHILLLGMPREYRVACAILDTEALTAPSRNARLERMLCLGKVGPREEIAREEDCAIMKLVSASASQDISEPDANIKLCWPNVFHLMFVCGG